MYQLYDTLLALAKEYPNSGATILGVIGMFFTALFGWLLKRPMIKASMKNDEFKATIDGMKELIESQQKVIDDHERDREHWVRGRAQLVVRIEELEARLNPWPDTPPEDATVIVAEDDNVSASILCRVIRKAGYEPFVTTRGYDALRHLRSGQFKLMILDFGMPDINGIDVAITARREGIDIPIIGITVLGDPSFKEVLANNPRMIEARFTAIISKTSRALDIERAIRDTLAEASGEAGGQVTG